MGVDDGQSEFFPHRASARGIQGSIFVKKLNWNRIKNIGGRETCQRFSIPGLTGMINALSPVEGVTKTAIHFQKHDDPEQVEKIERNGQIQGLNTGAFLVAGWEKPA